MQGLCEFLGGKLVWEGSDQGREIAIRFENSAIVQFSEIKDSFNSENKKESHIAFSSDDPRKDLEKIESWFRDKGLDTIKGRWSDDELWIDCPSVFMDFAIEILKTG